MTKRGMALLFERYSLLAGRTTRSHCSTRGDSAEGKPPSRVPRRRSPGPPAPLPLPPLSCTSATTCPHSVGYRLQARLQQLEEQLESKDSIRAHDPARALQQGARGDAGQLCAADALVQHQVGVDVLRSYLAEHGFVAGRQVRCRGLQHDKPNTTSCGWDCYMSTWAYQRQGRHVAVPADI